MSVGDIERKTQNRVVKLFQDKLNYEYLGNWEERLGNSNIEEDLLKKYLKNSGYKESLINKACDVFVKTANDKSKSLYDANKAVYSMLRYGVKVKESAGEKLETVWLINWKEPVKNDFAIAEEVTVEGKNTKRPDIVLYINGIAIGILELKRSTVSVSEGIRQNLDNQKPIFIRDFFITMQLIMAGNDTEGLRYAVIETPEKYYLTWKEDGEQKNLLDKHIEQICNKERLLE